MALIVSICPWRKPSPGRPYSHTAAKRHNLLACEAHPRSAAPGNALPRRARRSGSGSRRGARARRALGAAGPRRRPAAASESSPPERRPRGWLARRSPSSARAPASRRSCREDIRARTVPRRAVAFAAHPEPDASSLRRGGERSGFSGASGARHDPLSPLRRSVLASRAAARGRDARRRSDVWSVTLARTGAPIEALNRLRTKLSAIKGGRLGRSTAARLVTLVLSDVPGDRAASSARARPSAAPGRSRARRRFQPIRPRGRGARSADASG